MYIWPNVWAWCSGTSPDLSLRIASGVFLFLSLFGTLHDYTLSVFH